MSVPADSPRTPDLARLQKLAEVMQMVQDDCKDEAMSMDGKPFDGKTVAVQLGNLLAAVSAVAKGVQLLAEEFVPFTEGKSDG